MKNNYIIDGDTVRIELRRRKLVTPTWTVIDLADFEKVNAYPYTWTSSEIRGLRYVQQSKIGKFPQFLLHRYLLDETGSTVPIDHIDRDTLNNRRSNLRKTTTTIQSINRSVFANNKLGIRGVRKTRGGKFEAYAHSDGKQKSLGTYNTAEEARAAVGKHWEILGFGEEYARAA